MGLSLRTCLAGLAVALLLVGIVSSTLFRHLIQILPILMILVIFRRGQPLGAYAAMPVFVFWIGIVTLIWLFLAGLSGVASGQYTWFEIVLTFIIAACAGIGIYLSLFQGRAVSTLTAVAVFFASAALQVAAMWLSFLEPFASR